jgi:hypothetical protein
MNIGWLCVRVNSIFRTEYCYLLQCAGIYFISLHTAVVSEEDPISHHKLHPSNPFTLVGCLSGAFFMIRRMIMMMMWPRDGCNDDDVCSSWRFCKSGRCKSRPAWLVLSWLDSSLGFNWIEGRTGWVSLHINAYLCIELNVYKMFRKFLMAYLRRCWQSSKQKRYGLWKNSRRWQEMG